MIISPNHEVTANNLRADKQENTEDDTKLIK